MLDPYEVFAAERAVILSDLETARMNGDRQGELDALRRLDGLAVNQEALRRYWMRKGRK